MTLATGILLDHFKVLYPVQFTKIEKCKNEILEDIKQQFMIEKGDCRETLQGKSNLTMHHATQEIEDVKVHNRSVIKMLTHSKFRMKLDLP